MKNRKWIAAAVAASMLTGLALPAYAEAVAETEFEEYELTDEEMKEFELEAKAWMTFYDQMTLNEEAFAIGSFVNEMSDSMEEAENVEVRVTPEEGEVIEAAFTVVDDIIVLVGKIMDNTGSDRAGLEEVAQKWESTKANLRADFDAELAELMTEDFMYTGDGSEFLDEEDETEEESLYDEETDAEAIFAEAENMFDGLSIEGKVEYLETSLEVYDYMWNELLTFLHDETDLGEFMDSLGISANMEKTAPAEEADLETRLENVYQKTQLVSAIADPAYKLVKFFNM